MTRAPTEHAVDLDERIGSGLLDDGATLREGTQRRAYTTGIDQCGRGTSRLLIGTTPDSAGAFGVEYPG
jgi:hypothetical protein